MSPFRIKIAISFGEVIEFHGGGVFVFAAAGRKTSSVVGSRLTLIARGSDAHAQPAILMSAASDSRKVPNCSSGWCRAFRFLFSRPDAGKMQAHGNAAPHRITLRQSCSVESNFLINPNSQQHDGVISNCFRHSPAPDGCWIHWWPDWLRTPRTP